MSRPRPWAALALALLSGPLAAQTAEDFRSVPRPSDPWSALAEVPGVVLDRVNVGGSETAQSSLLVSHGDPGTGAVWTIDGFDVTDPAALGAPTVFPDLDALESLEARTSGTDVRVRTPGVQVGLRLRSPTRAFSGGAHLRYASNELQSQNLPADLAERGFRRSRTDELLELGAEAGSALQDGRLWLWGAVARNTLRQETFTGHGDSPRTTLLSGKARWRLGAGDLSLLLLRGEKVDDDRDPTTSAAPEARWRQTGPTTLAGLEDSRTLARFTVVSRLSYLDSGFRLDPHGGSTANAFQDVRGVSQGSFYSFRTSRARFAVSTEASGQRRFLGTTHELLFGLGYRRAAVGTDQSWPGNGVQGLEQGGVFFRAFRLTGFAIPYRGFSARSVEQEPNAFAQDTVRLGRFRVTAGLRLDRLAGKNRASSVDENREFPELLPDVHYAGGPSAFTWRDLLPRAGVEWAANASGTLRLHARYAAFGAPLGSAEVTFDNPIGRELGSVTYYWLDRNRDHTVDRGELDEVRGRVGTSGIDPRDPASITSPNRIDPGLRAPRTHEVAWGVAWTGKPSLQASVQTSYRAVTRVLWRPLAGLTSSDYVVRSGVTAELFGVPYSVGVFAPASESKIVPGNGRVLTNRPGYRQDAFDVDVALAGRAGRRLDWRVWAAWMAWREVFADRAVAVQDPTPLETEPLVGYGIVAVRPGGLGRGDLFVNARAMGGAIVRARLPLGTDATARLLARDGFPIPYFQVGNSSDPASPAKNVLIAAALDQYRLPSLWLLDARLSRGFRAGKGTLTADLDVFNLLNRATPLQVARDVELAAFNRTREIVRPRMVRLGLAYRF